MGRAKNSATCTTISCGSGLGDACTTLRSCVEGTGNCSQLCRMDHLCLNVSGTHRCRADFSGAYCTRNEDCTPEVEADVQFRNFLADFYVPKKFLCVSGECVAQPGPAGAGDSCAADADCMSNSCSGGVCVGLAAGSECLSSHACRDGYSCEEFYKNDTRYCVAANGSAGASCGGFAQDPCAEGLTCNLMTRKCVAFSAGAEDSLCNAFFTGYINVPIGVAYGEECASGLMCVADTLPCTAWPCPGKCKTIPSGLEATTCNSSFTTGAIGQCSQYQSCMCNYGSGGAPACQYTSENCNQYRAAFDACVRSRGCSSSSQPFMDGTCANGCLNDGGTGEKFFKCLVSAYSLPFASVASCRIPLEVFPGLDSPAAPAVQWAMTALW